MVKGTSLQSELQLCKSIIELLNYQGAYCWRTNSGAIRMKSAAGKEYMVRMAKAGTSDIIGLYNGRFFAFEVKLPGKEKTLTDLQKEFLKTIIHHGGIGHVVTTPEQAVVLLTTQGRSALN